MILEALGDNSSLENDGGAFLIIGIKCGFLREWLKRGNTIADELFLTKLQSLAKQTPLGQAFQLARMKPVYKICCKFSRDSLCNTSLVTRS